MKNERCWPGPCVGADGDGHPFVRFIVNLVRYFRGMARSSSAHGTKAFLKRYRRRYSSALFARALSPGVGVGLALLATTAVTVTPGMLGLELERLVAQQ